MRVKIFACFAGFRCAWPCCGRRHGTGMGRAALAAVVAAAGHPAHYVPCLLAVQARHLSLTPHDSLSPHHYHDAAVQVQNGADAGGWICEAASRPSAAHGSSPWGRLRRGS